MTVAGAPENPLPFPQRLWYLCKCGLWFLKRPRLYPELIRKIKNTLRTPASRRDDLAETAEAREWCERKSVHTRTAVEMLTGNPDFESFYTKFEPELREAAAAAAKCPARMGGAGNLELIYQLAEHIRAIRVVETGVAYGWSSLAFLLSLDSRDGAMLVSTDMPYVLKRTDQYVGCVVPLALRKKWTIISLPDRQALPKALALLGSIDMCHYDSDKTYEGRMWAYPRLWAALRKGGIFISDDVADNLAFRDFCSELGLEPVIAEARVGVLVKPCRPG